jgi:hypothetical protein
VQYWYYGNTKRGIRMKKLVVVLVVVLSVFSCENPVADLHSTDTSKYINGNTVTFPKGTRTVDIYNTIVSLWTDNEYHDVTNGSWKYIETSTGNDGLITQTWKPVSFTKIKHTHTFHENDVNTHTVYLYSDDRNIREIVFQWQRQTTNIWKNEPIQGDIAFTF